MNTSKRTIILPDVVWEKLKDMQDGYFIDTYSKVISNIVSNMSIEDIEKVRNRFLSGTTEIQSVGFKDIQQTHNTNYNIPVEIQPKQPDKVHINNPTNDIYWIDFCKCGHNSAKHIPDCCGKDCECMEFVLDPVETDKQNKILIEEREKRK